MIRLAALAALFATLGCKRPDATSWPHDELERRMQAAIGVLTDLRLERVGPNTFAGTGRDAEGAVYDVNVRVRPEQVEYDFQARDHGITGEVIRVFTAHRLGLRELTLRDEGARKLAGEGIDSAGRPVTVRLHRFEDLRLAVEVVAAGKTTRFEWEISSRGAKMSGGFSP